MPKAAKAQEKAQAKKVKDLEKATETEKKARRKEARKALIAHIDEVFKESPEILDAEDVFGALLAAKTRKAAQWILDAPGKNTYEIQFDADAGTEVPTWRGDGFTFRAHLRERE